MDTTRLGKTGLTVTRTGFGVLPIQRVELETATKILRRAFEAGVTFFDTARAYTDSEEKIGRALGDVRREIVIATKSMGTTRDTVLRDLETSLENLRTDYVDILQLHNPWELPRPDDKESSYRALVEAREQGMVRHLGITQHSLEKAREAVKSGLYATVQFPLSMISSTEDLSLIGLCAEHDVGLIAMKALCGGLLTNARAAFAFLRQYPNVVPIWGIQRLEELEEILAYDAKPPTLDEATRVFIEAERGALASNFCRACGYCLPCAVDIPIPMAARMGLLLGRMPTEQFASAEWQKKMAHVDDCTHCGQCADRCPYGLDTPTLLAEHRRVYLEWLGRR